MKTTLKAAAAVAVMAISVLSCGEDKATNPAPEKTIKVALYAGDGTGDWCKTATESMFEWMGYEVERISPEFINTSSLDEFDLICFPGGDFTYYSQDIDSGGMTRIRQFVSGGGAYIGICGGAYFASELAYWRGRNLAIPLLGLFSGSAIGPIDQVVAYPDHGMGTLDFVVLGHPIAEGESGSMSVLYWWGPYLSPDAEFDGVAICSYHETGTNAMVAFEYGEGRVFLTGSHPEVEEDGDRDGTDDCDDLTDPESEWDFMKKAAEWCLGEI